jgi:hypothetical protein
LRHLQSPQVDVAKAGQPGSILIILHDGVLIELRSRAHADNDKTLPGFTAEGGAGKYASG